MPLATVNPPASPAALAGTPSTGNSGARASSSDAATAPHFGGMVDAAATDAQAAQPATPTVSASANKETAPSPEPISIVLVSPAKAPTNNIVLPLAAPVDEKAAADAKANAAPADAQTTVAAAGALVDSLPSPALPSAALSVAAAANVGTPAAPRQPVAVALTAPASDRPKAPMEKEVGKDGDADAPSSAIASTAAISDAAQPSTNQGAALSIALAPVAAQAAHPSTPSPIGGDTSGAANSDSAGQASATNGGAPSLTAHQTAQPGGPADAPPSTAPRQDGLPATLFSQALNQHAAPNPLLSGAGYPPKAPATATTAVRAQAGQIGKDMGAVIARQVIEGREQVTVRLNPPEMGRVDVRLSFDHGGGLRAVMATESPAAMDLLRRDVGDLNRALADAGVRTDAQSFRFDGRHSGSGFTQSDHQRQRPQGGQSGSSGPGWTDPGAHGSTDRAYRPLRTSGGVDMLA